MLELVAGLNASRVAGEQGFGTTGKLLAAMLDLSAGQARTRTGTQSSSPPAAP